MSIIIPSSSPFLSSRRRDWIQKSYLFCRYRKIRSSSYDLSSSFSDSPFFFKSLLSMLFSIPVSRGLVGSLTVWLARCQCGWTMWVGVRTELGWLWLTLNDQIFDSFRLFCLPSRDCLMRSLDDWRWTYWTDWIDRTDWTARLRDWLLWLDLLIACSVQRDWLDWQYWWMSSFLTIGTSDDLSVWRPILSDWTDWTDLTDWTVWTDCTDWISCDIINHQ